MIFTTLISAGQLQGLLDAGKPVVLFDVSFELADPEAGERSWREGHVPGSRYLHLDRDLAGTKTGQNGRHPLPERAAFARTLGAHGVEPGSQVVAIDRHAGVYAARLWWLLRWLGHDAVAVLDGGVAAWTGAGGALETESAQARRLRPEVSARGPYPSAAALVSHVDVAALEARLGQVLLIDARAPERFQGRVEPLDPVAGHIPGAVNRCFKDNLERDGRFKSAAQLRLEFEVLLANRASSETVHQCGSGVTACHNLLAMEHAGFGGSLLYPGSWSEWCSDLRRAVATGAE